MNVNFWCFIGAVVAIIGFGIFCCSLDSVGGGSNKYSWVLCRLIARHIKLAFKLVFWFVVAGALIFGSLAVASEGSSNIHVGGGSPMPTGGGPESEKFYRTMNKATAPLRWVIDGFVAICGALAMLAAMFVLGNTGPLPMWKAQTSFGQGYIIYDGSHLQEAVALVYSFDSQTYANTSQTGVTTPTFDHSGGRTRDGGITWMDLGTPDEARRNYPNEDIPSTSFWGVGIVGEYQQHQLVGNLISSALYLFWLGFTIYDIVSDELLSDSKIKAINWSLATFGAWALLVFTVGYISVTYYSLLLG